MTSQTTTRIKRSTSSASEKRRNQKAVQPPPDEEMIIRNPGEYDIMLGKLGRGSNDRNGNLRHNALVWYNSGIHQSLQVEKSKKQMGILHREILALLKQTPNGTPCRFLMKCDTDKSSSSERWFEVSDEVARKKISQSFRNCHRAFVEAAKKEKASPYAAAYERLHAKRRPQFVVGSSSIRMGIACVPPCLTASATPTSTIPAILPVHALAPEADEKRPTIGDDLYYAAPQIEDVDDALPFSGVDALDSEISTASTRSSSHGAEAGVSSICSWENILEEGTNDGFGFEELIDQSIQQGGGCDE